MKPTTPYSGDLGDRDPLGAMRDTTARIRALTVSWTRDQFERSYAPGKWSARQLLTHLAQTELALGTRARMALATPGYVAQPFNQDDWILQEAELSGPDAVAALVAINRMNLALFESLPEAKRDTSFDHPEYGTISVDWIIHQMAGHQIQHLGQLEQTNRSEVKCSKSEV